jgi:hypothetical protein
MKGLGSIVFFGLIGYLSGGLMGYALVMSFAGNAHDRELEAAMTGAFFAGPLTAFLGALIACFRKGR